MRRILKKLDIYLDRNCARKVAVFCRCNNSLNEIENGTVNAYCVRPERDCKILTNKLVKSIQANGMPYAVFVYSIYGVAKENEKNLLINIPQAEGNNVFDQSGNEWNSKIYFNNTDEIEILKKTICEEACLRVYRKKEQNLICTIPFAFLRNIKENCLDKYFRLIQECFENAGNKLIAAEIESTMDNQEMELRGEELVYLASMLSCCLSRMIGILLDIEEKIYKEETVLISDRIIRGSFSDKIADELNNMDKESAIQFIKQLNRHSRQLEKCVCGDEYNIYSSSYKKLVEEENENKKCGDLLVSIFESMRGKYNENREEESKYIFCDEIMNLLKARFSKEEIYAAEIKVWDQGIATYDFVVDESGLRSRCGIGERSQLIFSIKYFPILKTFFEELSYGNNEYTQEQIDCDVEKLLSGVNALSPLEKGIFRKMAHSGMINLYNSFIEI